MLPLGRSRSFRGCQRQREESWRVWSLRVLLVFEGTVGVVARAVAVEEDHCGQCRDFPFLLVAACALVPVGGKTSGDDGGGRKAGGEEKQESVHLSCPFFG